MPLWGDLREEKTADIKDLKTLPMDLLQKPAVWSAEDWQEEWSQKLVAIIMPNIHSPWSPGDH